MSLPLFGAFHGSWLTRVKYSKEYLFDKRITDEKNYADLSNLNLSHSLDGYSHSAYEASSSNLQWHNYGHPNNLKLDRHSSGRGIWYTRGYGVLFSFFIKPKVVIGDPITVVQFYPFDKQGKKTTRAVCEIQVSADNFKGRSSAVDVDIMVATKTPEAGSIGSGFTGGWIREDGDRQLRSFFSSRRLKILQDDEDTLFAMADTFDEYLLEKRTTIYKTIGKTMVIGYGIEAINCIFLGGRCYSLPLKDHVLSIGVSNRDYGDLDTTYYRLDYPVWNKPNFRRFKPKFRGWNQLGAVHLEVFP
jgi:hypothetical protein